ncbi:MAG: serine/threonine protein kinase [Sulfobacillus sp.]
MEPPNPYRIIRRIGRGSSSVVYLVEDSRNKNLYAMKKIVVRSDFNDVRVLRILSGIPNVVQLRASYGDTIIMDYIRSVPFDPDDIYHIMQKLLAALKQIHARGVILKDIKLENILYDGFSPYFIDFGHAIIYRGEELCDMMGTIETASPERINGLGTCFTYEKAVKSDVYSLGVVFYQVYTGNLPFDGFTIEEISILQRRGFVPSGIEVIDSMLTYDYRKRPGVEELLRVLRA